MNISRSLRILCVLCCFPVLSLLLHGQARHIATDKSPAYLFADPAAGRIHLLTAGSDANFNGMLEPDSGDVSARWIVIDPVAERVVDSMTFGGFFTSFPPLRPAVDLQRGLLYVSQFGRIRAFSIASMELVRDTVVKGFYSAASFDSTGNTLILAERPGFTEPGYITLLDPLSNDSLGLVKVGVNPSSTVTVPSRFDGASELYTINEGIFGTAGSSISYTLRAPDLFGGLSSTMMQGAPRAVVSMEGRIYMLLEGGARLYVIDPRNPENFPVAPISLGISGERGGSALAFSGDSVVVIGMGSGAAVLVDADMGTLLDTIQFPGRIEALAVRDSLLFAALRYNLADSPDSMVVVANINTGLLVDTIGVPREPAAIFFAKNGDLHVIGMGAGESGRWWKVFDGATLSEKLSRGFTARMGGRTFQYAYDSSRDTLYAAFSDTLRALPVATAGDGSVPLFFTDSAATLSGVADLGEHLLVYENGLIPGTPGRVHVVDHRGNRTAMLRGSSDPIIAARVPGSREHALAFYVLGVRGDLVEQTTVDLFELQPNILGLSTLGKGLNHLFPVEDESLIATMNGSHELVVVDLDDWSLGARVPTGTSGFDGPRETVLLDDDHVLVSTYAGDVRVIDEKGNITVVPVGGKGESIAMMKDKAFVALPFTPLYAPDSNVAVLDVSTLVASVRRDDAIAGSMKLEQNFPNPASGSTTIRFAIDKPAHVTLALYTVTGQHVATVMEEQMEAGSYSAELSLEKLPSGSYIYVLRSGASVLSRVMEVVR